MFTLRIFWCTVPVVHDPLKFGAVWVNNRSKTAPSLIVSFFTSFCIKALSLFILWTNGTLQSSVDDNPYVSVV
jgi:hypothetical protein